MDTTQHKSHVFVGSIPVYGHVEKMKLVSATLIQRGYSVTFITGSHFRKVVESTGARFVPLGGIADYNSDAWPKTHPEWAKMPPGLERYQYEHKKFFIEPMKDQFLVCQREFAKFRERSNESIIFLSELAFQGNAPVAMGASGIRPDYMIGLGIAPLQIASIDTGPFNAHMLPDSSPVGRQRNIVAQRHFENVWRGPQRSWEQQLSSLGAKGPFPFLLDGFVKIHDRYLQMCIRALEYSRSDEPDNLRFIGAIPGVGLDTASSMPNWWREVIKGEKRVVVVSQGSISNDPSDLICPTITALKDMDVLLVCTLMRSNQLDNFPIAANTRVTRFIPFDKLFKYADVLVSNGGYGTVQQALYCGIPMVLAGEGEDKPESNMRTAWTGAAINLMTQRATPVQVRGAVQEVLQNPNYKKKALELSREYQRSDAVGAIADTIDEFAGTNAWTTKGEQRRSGEQKETIVHIKNVFSPSYGTRNQIDRTATRHLGVS